MKIELKRLKVSRFASRGPVSFEATVFIDGVRAGEARNAGDGGANH